MANFLFLTGGNSNNGSAYQLFASCRNQGGETAGSVAYDSSVRTFGGETAGSIASSSVIPTNDSIASFLTLTSSLDKLLIASLKFKFDMFIS